MKKLLSSPVWLIAYLLSVVGTFGVGQSISYRNNSLAELPELQSASIGWCVIDVATGRVVARHRSGHALIPASTQKLLITGAAFDLLGPDYRYTTTLEYDGTIDRDGTLHGNLYLRGTGDPSLGSSEMEGVTGLRELLQRFRRAVERAGIRRIEGFVIGDGSLFSGSNAGPDWPWADIGNYYGAGAYGLNLHENLYYLDFLQRSELGATPPIQHTRPQIPELTFVNEVRTAERGSGDNAYIYGTPFNYRNYVRGTIPAGRGRFTIKGAIPDPPLFAAQQLTNALRQAGIPCAAPAATVRALGPAFAEGRQRTVVDTYRSPPLRDLIERANFRSVNLYCEALLRTLGVELAGEGTPTAGLQVLEDYLADQGLATATIQLVDGSGLSPRNFFPPELMARYLYAKAGDERLRATIPLAGRTGSLRNALRGTAAEGRLWAKSGSVSAVRCFAGYARTRRGRELVFSVMVNNYTATGAQVRRALNDWMVSLCTID
jgi:D-alanyl-D-alanine carboxypeptidase/D-alanyl-D-alanine-endopeptidase (penicillin-binding protein 4)